MKASISKTVLAFAALATMGAGAAVGALASADTATTGATGTGTATEMHRGFGPGVMGSVTAINGTTITLTGMNNTTYSVDASAATIRKSQDGAAPKEGTIADIAVGDKIGVRGTVSGTSVAATEIMDGIPPRGMHGKGRGVQGTVTAVNGTTLTVAGNDGTTYTVDAAAAKASKVTAIQISDITVGDTIGVGGNVSGTSVTATHIMDGELPMPNAPPAPVQ